jgi:glycosyltransferase involved in cell wall biosynthesis
MTVVIASHQRRDAVLRLLRGLDAQFAAGDGLAGDMEVVVVLDGSTDGSREAIERASWSVPVRVHAQPNRGRAVARNAGLELVQTPLVWFLDDDLVPAPGLVARHRQAHADGQPRVVVGPCLVPEDADAPDPFLRWWDAFYEDLEDRDSIDRFDRFTVANASAPVAVLRDVGGFESTFVEYGLEDYELAVRLLRANVAVQFDAEAIAWHPDVPPMSVLIARQHGLGVNAARLARMHPETRDVLFPAVPISRQRRLLRRLRLRDPRALRLVSRLAFGIYRVTDALPFTPPKGEMMSRAAAHAAGVAEGDPTGELLARVLGYDAARTA